MFVLIANVRLLDSDNKLCLTNYRLLPLNLGLLIGEFLFHIRYRQLQAIKLFAIFDELLCDH